MRILTVMLMGMVLLISGCSLRLPGVGVDIGNGNGNGGQGGSSHCPPGQAKKGQLLNRHFRPAVVVLCTKNTLAASMCWSCRW